MPPPSLLVDDEPLAREGLRALLSRDAEVMAICKARDGREQSSQYENATSRILCFSMCRWIRCDEDNWRGYMPTIVLVTVTINTPFRPSKSTSTQGRPSHDNHQDALRRPANIPSPARGGRPCRSHDRLHRRCHGRSGAPDHANSNLRRLLVSLRKSIGVTPVRSLKVRER
jgi:hypothetical protein